MKKSILTFVCVVAAITSQGQSVFQVTDVPGLGAPSYFEIGSDTGLFWIDNIALFPATPDDSTALITTPAGTLTFSIGIGTPCDFSLDQGDPFPDPFIPPQPPGVPAPLEISGEYFTGSFQSSANVYDDLLAGQGEFQVGSGTSSPMEVVVAPEPGCAVLFLGGLMLLLMRRSRIYEYDALRSH